MRISCSRVFSAGPSSTIITPKFRHVFMMLSTSPATGLGRINND